MTDEELKELIASIPRRKWPSPDSPVNMIRPLNPDRQPRPMPSGSLFLLDLPKKRKGKRR